MSEINLWDFVKSINKKDNLKVDDNNKFLYNKFIVNKNFSLYQDSIFYANEVNQYNCITEEMNFDFYYYGLEKRNRWTSWPKKNMDERLTIIQKYYKVGRKDAICISENMQDVEFKKIKEKYDNIKTNEE